MQLYTYLQCIIYVYMASCTRSKSSTVLDGYWRGQSSNSFHDQKQLTVNHVMSLSGHLNFQPTKTNVCSPCFFRRNVVGLFLKLDTPATPRNGLASKEAWCPIYQWVDVTEILSVQPWAKSQRVTLFSVFPWTNAGNLTSPAKNIQKWCVFFWLPSGNLR